jgi:aspartate carbamoyltransferase catalytic subunit
MATLFYEPSTRTRMSFESAMLRLGGQVITSENARDFSSAIKGETIEDTIRIVDDYADCVVIRHYEEGAAARAAKLSKVPVINAGDGKGQHPTQALLDLYTVQREFGHVDGLRFAMVGDLASGRTVRSLCYLLGKFKDVSVTFVAPDIFRMKEDIKEYLDRHKIRWDEKSAINQVLGDVDVIYLTRVQKERIKPEDLKAYQPVKDNFILNQENLQLVRPEARILHPLPKVDEIALPVEVENKDPRVAYFRQASNGLYARMALLEHLLNK